LGCLVVFPKLFRAQWLRFDLNELALTRALRQLGSIMAPAMVSQLMPPASAMLATAIVAGFGSAAVAAWGLGTRLEFFSIVVVLALTMSMPPMIGRMLGAGEIDRIRSLIRIAVRFVVALHLVIGLLWAATSGLAATVFTSDREVSDVLNNYLLLVPLSYSGLGVCILMVSICNALGLAMRALLVSTIRLFVCFLPPLWIGAQIAGISGLMAGALAGNLMAGIMAYGFYRRGMGLLVRKQVQD
jgi:Na+-driven multidrug efflux pump